MSKIDFTSSPFGCWIWTASIVHGYGSIGMSNRGSGTIATHRASWILFRGPIPKGMCVCHNCPGGDNRACVNPDHFFIGTRPDNNRDARSKGVPCFLKHPKHEEHPNCKLTWAIVDKMRLCHLSGVTAAEIGRRFHISKTLAWKVVTEQLWVR